MNQHSDWRLYGTLIFFTGWRSPNQPVSSPPARPPCISPSKKEIETPHERARSVGEGRRRLYARHESLHARRDQHTQKRKERINKFWNLRHLIGWRARFVPLCLSLSICIYVLEPIRLGQSCLLRRCSMVILRRFSCLLRACP